MAAVGATNLWYESQPMLLLLLGLVLVGSAYAGWRESCELFWATWAFLAGCEHAPMTSVLACEFHMLPKTCGWPQPALLLKPHGLRSRGDFPGRWD